jgi:plastocyanin domain-containing protein
MKRGFVNAGTLVLIGSGMLALASCNNEKASPSGEHADHAGHMPARQLSVTVDGQGFHPASLTAPANEHVRVTFKRTSDEGCAKQVVFPSSNVRRDLPLNQPVDVDVHMPASGSLAFQCGMGMLKGSIAVQ